MVRSSMRVDLSGIMGIRLGRHTPKATRRKLREDNNGALGTVFCGDAQSSSNAILNSSERVVSKLTRYGSGFWVFSLDSINFEGKKDVSFTDICRMTAEAYSPYLLPSHNIGTGIWDTRSPV